MANNSAIQAMIAAGADAQKNMFDVFVTFPWDTNNEVIVSTRATGFEIKDATVETEERNYHGHTIKVPKTKVTMDRTFSLEFRLDASYAFYNQFITWHQTVGDPVNGGVANWANATGKVRVQALSGTYAATAVSTYIDQTSTYALADSDDNAEWTFYDVWVSHVTQPKFENSDGGALTFTVDFIFGDCDYPFYNSGSIQGTGSGGYVPTV